MTTSVTCELCNEPRDGAYRFCRRHLEERIEASRRPRLNPPDELACPNCASRDLHSTAPGTPCHSCGVISPFSDVSNFAPRRDAQLRLFDDEARQ